MNTQTSDHEAFLRETAHFWDVPEPISKPTTAPMPLVTAISSLPVLISLVSLPAASVVIATAAVANDICAVLGALIASVLTLIEARKKDRSMGHTISVFLGTASVGSFLPGLLMQLAVHRQWIAPDTATAFGWEAWAFAGLVLGMNAWWILHGINRWLQRRAETTSTRATSSMPARKVAFGQMAQPGDYCFAEDHSYIYVWLPGASGPDALRIARGPAKERWWGWDGNEEQPTLTPSIHDPGHWHGYLTAGVFKSC